VIFPTNLTRYTRGNFTGEFLSSSDRTHSFRGVLQHSLGDDEGVDLGGFKPFANTTASLTYTAQSGTPFTWPPTDISLEKGIVNNRRFPIESSFDLNIVKTFSFSGTNATLGLRVMNLFDNKWLTPTDVRDDLINLVDNGITVADPGNDPLRQSYAVAQYRAYRNLPRQVFFTVGIGF
jgi:hypothetical protein